MSRSNVVFSEHTCRDCFLIVVYAVRSVFVHDTTMVKYLDVGGMATFVWALCVRALFSQSCTGFASTTFNPEKL